MSDEEQWHIWAKPGDPSIEVVAEWVDGSLVIKSIRNAWIEGFAPDLVEAVIHGDNQ